MSTSAQLETSWTNAIWNHATIQALTDKVLRYQITTDSEQENSLLYFDTKVNFFEALTGRSQRYLTSSSYIGATIQYLYTVEINYYRELDTDGTNFRAIRDAYETLFALVVSELGNTWTNTVEIWRPQEDIPTIVEVLVNNKKCWKGTYRFFAEKLTEL